MIGLPQWRGAGSKIEAPKLVNTGFFKDFRSSINNLIDERSKAEKLKAKNARYDKLLKHEEEFKKGMEQQRFDNSQKISDRNHGYRIEEEGVKFGNSQKISDRNHGYRVEEEGIRFGNDGKLLEQKNKYSIGLKDLDKRNSIEVDNNRSRNKRREIGAEYSAKTAYEKATNKKINGGLKEGEDGYFDIGNLVAKKVVSTKKVKYIDENVKLDKRYYSNVELLKKKSMVDYLKFKKKLDDIENGSGYANDKIERALKETLKEKYKKSEKVFNKKKDEFTRKYMTREKVVPDKVVIDSDRTALNFANYMSQSGKKAAELKPVAEYLKRITKGDDDVYNQTLKNSNEARIAKVKNAQNAYDEMIKNGYSQKDAESDIRQKFKSVSDLIKYY